VFGFSARRMLLTQMFSFIATKSREGAWPGSQPKLASGNIPYRGHHEGWLGGNRNLSFLFPVSADPPFSASLHFSRSSVILGNL